MELVIVTLMAFVIVSDESELLKQILKARKKNIFWMAFYLSFHNI